MPDGVTTLNGLVGRLPTTLETQAAPGEIDKNGFLKLLIEQMKNQDPMNPMDSQEYASSLAQFTQLEEMQNLNTVTEQGLQADVILAQSINNTLSATLVGQSVKAAGDQVLVNDGDAGDITFDLASSGKVNVSILNSAGEVVRTIETNTLGSGDQSISWNGKDDDGHSLPDGSYTLQLTATNAAGESIRVSPYLIGKVEAVRYESTGAVLVINGQRIGFGDVVEIRQTESDDGNDGTSIVAGLFNKIGL